MYKSKTPNLNRLSKTSLGTVLNVKPLHIMEEVQTILGADVKWPLNNLMTTGFFLPRGETSFEKILPTLPPPPPPIANSYYLTSQPARVCRSARFSILLCTCQKVKARNVRSHSSLSLSVERAASAVTVHLCALTLAVHPTAGVGTLAVLSPIGWFDIGKNKLTLIRLTVMR